MLSVLTLGLLLVIAMVVAVGIAATRQRGLSTQRNHGLAVLAAQYGLHFATANHALARRWSGTPFLGGEAGLAFNVLTGRYGDRQVVAFEYQFTVYKQGTYRFSVVVVRLPAALPRLAVDWAASGLEVLTGALRPQAIELESERFNESFRVLADDPRFAHAVVHPRMMELLLQRGEVPWRIDGADLIGWAEGPLEIGNVLRRIAVLSEVAGLIPPFVFTDYGRDPRLG
jgi:hypothetical protein